MYYEVKSIETLDNGQTRTVAWFWNDRADYLRRRNDPRFREDFITNVPATHTRVVTNDDGWWKLADGTFVDPAELDPEGTYEFERETVAVDVKAVLEENIERFLFNQREDGDTNAARIERGDLVGDRTSAQLARREVPNRADHIRDTNVRDMIGNPREPRTREEREVRR